MGARSLNAPSLPLFLLRYIKSIGMLGVLRRGFSFGLVGWVGPEGHLLFVWVFNAADAVALS